MQGAPHVSHTQVTFNNPIQVDIDMENLPIKCHFEGCQVTIGKMTSKEIYTHFEGHSLAAGQATADNRTSIKCPLLNAKGEVCSQELSLVDDGADFRFHYCHRGTHLKQEAVIQAGYGEDVEFTTHHDLSENLEAQPSVAASKATIVTKSKGGGVTEPAGANPKKHKSDDGEEDIVKTSKGAKKAKNTHSTSSKKGFKSVL